MMELAIIYFDHDHDSLAWNLSDRYSFIGLIIIKCTTCLILWTYLAGAGIIMVIIIICTKRSRNSAKRRRRRPVGLFKQHCNLKKNSRGGIYMHLYSSIERVRNFFPLAQLVGGKNSRVKRKERKLSGKIRKLLNRRQAKLKC